MVENRMIFPRNPDTLATELLKCCRYVPGLDELYTEAAALLRAQATRIAELERQFPRGSAMLVGEPIIFEVQP
jgi:hypothetical protein